MAVNGEPLIVYAGTHAPHPRVEDGDVADPLTPAEDEAFPALPARQIERFARPPLLFETSCPGVFAIDDVRANSVKRVAIGDGGVCVQLVHRALAES
jgi:hypothetical protein